MIGRAKIRSTFRFFRPSSLRFVRVFWAFSALWFRPRNLSSLLLKDWTPTLIRLMPASRMAFSLGFALRPGLISIVISGVFVRMNLALMSSMISAIVAVLSRFGVPPPQNIVSMIRSG